MQAEASHPTLLRFSTRDLPASERVSYWREFFGRQICRVEIEPQNDGPIASEVTILGLPGLGVAWSHSATPACWKRTPELVKDGSDDVALLIAVGGSLTRSQLGHEIAVEAGEGVGILHDEPASLRFQALRHIALMVPRAALAPYVANIENTTTRLIPRGNGALRLLVGYLTILGDGEDMSDPTICRLITGHVYDLVAMAIGATRDGHEIARGRGARAARLKAIKDDLAANLSLTLDVVAARQGVSTRYVQMLFDQEGTTFSAYALEQRLGSAHRMLTSPRYADWTISAIALEAGFGDLSHFNRNFRRRFGASPSEIRAEARRSDGE